MQSQVEEKRKAWTGSPDRAPPLLLIALAASAILLILLYLAYDTGLRSRTPAQYSKTAATGISPGPQTRTSPLDETIARLEMVVSAGPRGLGNDDSDEVSMEARQLLDECLFMRARRYESRDPEKSLVDLARISAGFREEKSVLDKIVDLKERLSGRLPPRQETARNPGDRQRTPKKRVQTKVKPKQPAQKAQSDDPESYNSFLLRYFKNGIGSEPPSYEEWRSSRNADKSGSKSGM
ncbi:MAG: hypothetical protein KC777_27845 [Cyanobacteria bacterium HKST-UBA02]|nr:hypothetical protein [Cyanobacteria bacterium HKST-UBA02]